jgi:hypothetical protein
VYHGESSTKFNRGALAGRFQHRQCIPPSAEKIWRCQRKISSKRVGLYFLIRSCGSSLLVAQRWVSDRFFSFSPLCRNKEIPDPVKLIRRICALERAILDLAEDCQQIEQHRNRVAPAVIKTQQKNVALLNEVSGIFSVDSGW